MAQPPPVYQRRVKNNNRRVSVPRNDLGVKCLLQTGKAQRSVYKRAASECNCLLSFFLSFFLFFFFFFFFFFLSFFFYFIFQADGFRPEINLEKSSFCRYRKNSND